MLDNFDESAAKAEHDLHPARLHAQVLKSMNSGPVSGRAFAPSQTLIQAATQLLHPREIVVFALPTQQGSMFLQDESWRNVLLVVTDQRVIVSQVENSEAVHLSKLQSAKFQRTGTAYEQLVMKFMGKKITLNVHRNEIDNSKLGWTSLVSFLNERARGRWTTALPNSHPLELKSELSIVIPAQNSESISSPETAKSIALEPQEPIAGSEDVTASASNRPHPESEEPSLSGKSAVLFGCFLPFLYFSAGVFKVFSEMGSLGLWDAIVVAFWWIHVPAGITFLAMYFFSLAQIVRRQHRVAAKESGAEKSHPVDELPSVIIAFVIAATLSYLVMMATGPFAPFERCMKDLSDLGVAYEVRLESCNRYLP